MPWQPCGGNTWASTALVTVPRGCTDAVGGCVVVVVADCACEVGAATIGAPAVGATVVASAVEVWLVVVVHGGS
jgi:hypothetical protein